MMDVCGICGVWETKKKRQTKFRDREIDDDENVIRRNVDANYLLDVKVKYLLHFALWVTSTRNYVRN
jgi:hypothetical protein